MDTVKVIAGGIVAVGLITAFGLHASGLAQLATSGGKATSQIFNTAERG